MDKKASDQKDLPSPHVAVSSPDLQKQEKTAIILRSKITRHLAPMTLAAVLMVGLTTAVYLSQNKQDVRNYAAETNQSSPSQPKNVNLILHMIKNPSTGEITVEEARANNGYTLYTPPDIHPDMYTDEIQQVVNGNVVSTTKVFFSDTLFGDRKDPNSQEMINANVTLPKPEVFISLQTTTNASFQVKDLKSNSTKVLNQSKISNVFQNVQTVNPNPNAIMESSETKTSPEAAAAGDGYLDLVFISDNYSDFAKFDQDVDWNMNFLRAHRPFSDLSNKIRVTKIHNSEPLCTPVGWGAKCNRLLIYSIASQVNGDFPIVVADSDDEFGWAYLGGMVYMDRGEPAGYPTGLTLMHELGHAVGWLWDEYDYGSTTSWEENFANCDENPSCSDWNGKPGINCFQVCGYRNWYKPTNNKCIMGNFWYQTIYQFDFVDEPVMRHAITGYTSGGGPGPTNPPATGCFNYTGPGTVETNKYIRYSISLNGKTLTQYSSSGACYEATAGTGDPAGCTSTGENCCFVGQTGSECGGHTATRSNPGTCTISAALSDGTSCSLSVQVQKPVVSPTPTSNPSPTPWIQVRVQNTSGQAVPVTRISRANCTTSPCTQSLGQANISTAQFPGGGANIGGRITSSQYVVIGVTPSPNTGKYYPKCRGAEAQTSCYVWPAWNTGARRVTFVVATPTPKP